MTIKYSQATSDQIEEFYSFFSKSVTELFPEYTVLTREYFIEKDYTKEWMKGVISKQDKILFVARNGKDIAGYLLVNKVYGGVSVASWLAVFKDYQKIGVASTLMKMWESFAIDNHAHALQLWTTDKNVSFYIKRGFVNAGIFKDGWFGIDMPMLYKPLRKSKEKNYLHKYLASKSK